MFVQEVTKNLRMHEIAKDGMGCLYTRLFVVSEQSSSMVRFTRKPVSQK